MNSVSALAQLPSTTHCFTYLMPCIMLCVRAFRPTLSFSALLDAGYAVFAPTLPGFGGSEKVAVAGGYSQVGSFYYSRAAGA